MRIFIDCEGFILKNKFIIKEFAYVNVDTGESMCYFLKTPYYKLSKTEFKTIQYVINNFHNINWSFGSTELNYLKKYLFQSLWSNIDIKLYAKGSEKAKYFSNIINKDVVNVEDIGCITLDVDSTVCCGYKKHQSNSHCALKKATIYGYWLKEQ